MQPGEKELRKVFEDTTTNNVRATVEHSNVSRKIIREMEEKVTHLEDQLRQTNAQLEALRVAMSQVQMKMYTLEARV